MKSEREREMKGGKGGGMKRGEEVKEKQTMLRGEGV